MFAVVSLAVISLARVAFAIVVLVVVSLVIVAFAVAVAGMHLLPVGERAGVIAAVRTAVVDARRLLAGQPGMSSAVRSPALHVRQDAATARKTIVHKSEYGRSFTHTRRLYKSGRIGHSACGGRESEPIPRTVEIICTSLPICMHKKSNVHVVYCRMNVDLKFTVVKIAYRLQAGRSLSSMVA